MCKEGSEPGIALKTTTFSFQELLIFVLLKDQGDSDGLPLFPSLVGEVAGIDGAHPTLMLAFSQKETGVHLGMASLAVFQALRLCTPCCAGCWWSCSTVFSMLSLPEYNQHLSPVSEMMEYPAHKDNLQSFLCWVWLECWRAVLKSLISRCSY